MLYSLYRNRGGGGHPVAEVVAFTKFLSPPHGSLLYRNDVARLYPYKPLQQPPPHFLWNELTNVSS